MPVDLELAQVVCAAASLQPRHRRAVERCLTDPSPRRDLAREGGQLIRAYVELGERVRVLASSELTARVTCMLDCHMQTMSQAMSLAFQVHDSRWPALAARFGDGLGSVADDLLYLAADLSRLANPA